MVMDVASDGVEGEDAGVIERIDGYDFQQNMANVAVVRVLAEEFFEGVLGQLVFVVEF
jgi:hypothetical protein